MIGIRHDGNLLSLRQTAGPDEVRHDDVRGSLFQNFAEGVAGNEPLADALRHSRFLRKPQQIVRALRLYHVFHPQYPIRLERPPDANGVVEIPAAVSFDHDLHSIADTVTDAFHALESGLQVPLGEIGTGVTG